jgi:hypothetical protein
MSFTDLNKIPSNTRNRYGAKRRLYPGDMLRLEPATYSIIDMNGNERPARQAQIFIISMTPIDEVRQIALNDAQGFSKDYPWCMYTIIEVDNRGKFNFRTQENPLVGAWTYWEKISK